MISGIRNGLRNCPLFLSQLLFLEWLPWLWFKFYLKCPPLTAWSCDKNSIFSKTSTVLLPTFLEHRTRLLCDMLKCPLSLNDSFIPCSWFVYLWQALRNMQTSGGTWWKTTHNRPRTGSSFILLYAPAGYENGHNQFCSCTKGASFSVSDWNKIHGRWRWRYCTLVIYSIIMSLNNRLLM